MQKNKSSQLQLRQICLVANNLDRVVDNLLRILGLDVCYVDPNVARYGLENSLMAVGDNFLEVVAPTREETAAGRYLKRRNGDGGYMVITQSADMKVLQNIRQRALDCGVRVAHELEREGWVLCQLHPADMEAAFLEIEWDSQEDFDGNWYPAGGIGWKKHVRSHRTRRLLGAELQSSDPQTLAQHWSAVTGIELSEREGKITLPMNNAWLSFVPLRDDRGPGLCGIFLEVADEEAILREAASCGCLDERQQVIIGGVVCYLLPGVQSNSERQSS